MRPPPLVPGDVVRVVAPSSPFDPAPFEAGLAVLRDRLGLRPRHRADLSSRTGYLAGGDARRLEEWREAVGDAEARAIFCARGGYGVMRLLPHLDPAPLLARPKILVGFSDVTALHALLNRAGLATVHGPVVTQLGRAPDDAIEHLAALLTGRAPPAGPWSAPAPGAGLVGTATLVPGRASGPLLGGSLTLLAALCGTPYLPPLDGAILVLEDVGERPYRLDRTLTQLRLAGALDHLAGVAVGQLTACDDGDGAAAEVVRQLVRALGVPAIEGLPVGHEDRNLALPLGPRATLVAPGPGEEGPPRLLFDEGATATPPPTRLAPREA
ncbi:MAG: LD-carboxypeptidase [Anaeromyxobacter sp.]|nr:LD-carboxypeptidase [Anaeromyxobacter sp.]MBL0277473.1 LD-carboxypeptidase [Anaeromyxobacter sp.]